MVIRQVTNLVSTQSEVKKPREGESNSGDLVLFNGNVDDKTSCIGESPCYNPVLRSGK